jgi:hypothetical protein
MGRSTHTRPYVFEAVWMWGLTADDRSAVGASLVAELTIHCFARGIRALELLVLVRWALHRHTS